MEKIIELKKVNKWFGKFQVLKDINLSVSTKEKLLYVDRRDQVSLL